MTLWRDTIRCLAAALPVPALWKGLSLLFVPDYFSSQVCVRAQWRTAKARCLTLLWPQSPLPTKVSQQHLGRKGKQVK